jgi:hypothetical protein
LFFLHPWVILISEIESGIEKESMNLILVLAAFVCLAAGAALVFIFRRLIAGPKSLPVSVDWINDLSIARYRPMERLLNEEDLRFLASQPGFDRKTLRRIRAERRGIFRGYLACLSREFALVGAALRLMMTYSAQDRPDLAGILYKQQALFMIGMLGVHWRLVLHACGLGKVDVSGLVRVMESMRLELRQMIPAESAAGA